MLIIETTPWRSIAGAIDSDRARRSTYSLSVSSFFSFSGKPSRPPIPFPLSIPSSTAAALLPPPRRGASRAPRGQRGSREGGGQYGEAPRPHERREIKVQQQPIRRGAATARAPRGPGAEAANTASGACPATIRPPRRARPCSYASYPGWTSPRASSPPASPSFPTASATPRRLRGCPGTTHLPLPSSFR